MNRTYRRLITSLLMIVVAGCTVYAQRQLDDIYGKASVVDRHYDTAHSTATPTEPPAYEFYNDVKPIIDRRCVVCHGCYDAPCQLKMSSIEAIDRGASEEKVYKGARLLVAKTSRLYIDAQSTQQWRDKNFYPVLNERIQTPEANTQASLMYRMLELKREHPLPRDTLLPDSFDFALNRDQQCPKIETFNKFAQQYPLWGMPYGLPALENHQHAVLKQWLENGAKAKSRPELSAATKTEIAMWEDFLNGESMKERLMSRYIYEHLFLASIYFGDGSNTRPDNFFNLVRSTTPTGQAIEVIPTRRPFDDPGTGDFYYRLDRVKTTILVKRHMPYKFDAARLKRWHELFIVPDYAVTELPSYHPEVAANPFVSFEALPVKSRYQFMLDEAHFTIMGFIKGPVCRGQIALNVINDHFWVVFVEPDAERLHNTAKFLSEQRNHLSLPAEDDSTILPISRWMKYSRQHQQYFIAKTEHLNREFPNSGDLDLDLIWDGDGNNRNAALTIFRHFDSSTVEKGLLGDTPKTAWVIGYSLLERIHYLLVAGFDVYGNSGHQLLTRLYMDFLRMEGEYNFLNFLPGESARVELDFWYRGEEDKVGEYLNILHLRNVERAGTDYKTTYPKQEFFELLTQKLGPKVIPADLINRTPLKNAQHFYQRQLQQLAAIKGGALTQLPEQSLLSIQLEDGSEKVFSLVRNRAHSNVSSLLSEQSRILPEEQTLSVLEGISGSYPNAFYQLSESKLPEFVAAVASLNNEEDYRNLLGRYGIRRNNPVFWQFSDKLHDQFLADKPFAAGLLDYNRFENR